MRPTVRNTPAHHPAVLLVLLLTALALVGTVAVGQRAAADERWRDDIWVSVDGVAFQRGGESDEVAYVVRPVGTYRGSQAFSRDLSRDEQNRGWAAFWEARQAFPDGYCVVWVEVEDASNWHESEDGPACNAADTAATSTPTPTPTPTKADKPAQNQAPAAAQEPAQPKAKEQEAAPTPSETPTASESPTPTPTPTPSPTPSATPSSTPSPSPSRTPSAAPLPQNVHEPRSAVAAEQDEIISPLGWVAVLGVGGLLTVGGLLMLWRRLV